MDFSRVFKNTMGIQTRKIVRVFQNIKCIEPRKEAWDFWAGLFHDIPATSRRAGARPYLILYAVN